MPGTYSLHTQNMRVCAC